MMGSIILLTLILALPGQAAPVVFQEEVASLEVCMIAARAYLDKAAEVQRNSAEFSAGCTVVTPPTVEH